MIRRMREGDERGIHNIIQEHEREHLGKDERTPFYGDWSRLNPDLTLVAEDVDGNIVALMTALESGQPCAYVDTYAVHPKYIQGATSLILCRRMFEAMKCLLKSYGVKYLVTHAIHASAVSRGILYLMKHGEPFEECQGMSSYLTVIGD